MSAAVAEDQRGSYFSMQHTPSTQKQFAAAGEDDTNGQRIESTRRLLFLRVAVPPLLHQNLSLNTDNNRVAQVQLWNQGTVLKNIELLK
jgi:hypothetical protein